MEKSKVFFEMALPTAIVFESEEVWYSSGCAAELVMHKIVNERIMTLVINNLKRIMITDFLSLSINPPN
jgi:hypothetical protein